MRFPPGLWRGVSPAPALESPRSRGQPSRSDEEPAGAILPASCEEGERDEEDIEPLETSLESLDEGPEDDEDEDVFRLDAPVEDVDEGDEDSLLETEDEEEECPSVASKRGMSDQRGGRGHPTGGTRQPSSSFR